MALELELDAFARMKEQLLTAYEDKFVLLKGEQFLGSYDTAEAAYNAGVGAFGQEPFLVKKVSRVEQVFTNHALSHGLIHAHL
jgi:hypothetical protein